MQINDKIQNDVEQWLSNASSFFIQDKKCENRKHLNFLIMLHLFTLNDITCKEWRAVNAVI